MKKIFSRMVSLVVLVVLVITMVACGNNSQTTDNEVKTINIAYQYGLAYAPLAICQNKKLVEESYRELTGKEINVNWIQMSSGADINTGIASGDIQAGFMGCGPAITGISKKLGYKIFTNLSGQKNGLMTSLDDVNSLEDIVGSDKQIALVNIGSIQHIILAKALKDNGYDSHALDSNIVAMKHPDGYASLQSGNIPLHLTANPYIYKEEETEGIHEITEVADAWTSEKSFIVGIASEQMHDQDQDMYKALSQAIEKSIEFVNDNPNETVAITAELDGNTVEDELKYIELGSYSPQTNGVLELATFMYSEGFIENEISSFSDLVFDNVKGN